MNILIKVSYQKTVFCLYQSLIMNITMTQMIISITMSFMNLYRLVEYHFNRFIVCLSFSLKFMQVA